MPIHPDACSRCGRRVAKMCPSPNKPHYQGDCPSSNAHFLANVPPEYRIAVEDLSAQLCAPCYGMLRGNHYVRPGADQILPRRIW